MKRLLFLFFFWWATSFFYAQTLEETAQTRISELNTLITQAEGQSIDVRKERMAIRVAEVFLYLADWDEGHLNEVQANFQSQLPVIPLDKNASQLANELPDWERSEVILMLENRISELNELLTGNRTRKDFVPINWANLEIEGARIVQNGQPIFGNDWTFKDDKKVGPYRLNDFFGALDGYFFAPTFLERKNDGSIGLRSGRVSQLNNLPSGNFGAPFLGTGNLPSFIENEFPDITNGRAEFVAFDIDHPQSRPLFSALLNEVVPKLKGKNMSKLGYMLSNEPHWNTSGTWDIVDFTTYTRAKFATWLEAKHQSIANLNTLWGTSHASFQSASNDSDLQPSRTNKRGVLESLRGTPKWYDFMRFNQVRVNNWFTYLHDEIQGIDAAAKTHIKLIPFQWTDNDRGSGLDFEYLIGLCEVIGHDAHMDGSRRFGNRPWQNKYMFDWLPLTMSHDFFHSIKPNATNYNSETHILYNVRFREAFLRTSYVRASHWLATLHGMDMSLNWVWARQEDGSLSPNFGVATTVGQQPRTLFELHSTILDLNSYANEISELQEIQNPIRIFYSETSAINKDNHMSQLSDLYESLYFEGYRLGFVTENILNTQSLADFNYVVVKDVEFVKESEIDALQNYLNNGGVVFLDTVSLKKDEYGKNHTKTLSAGTGMILPLGSNPKSSILNKLSADGIKSAIEVAEVNEDSNVLKAVAHKSVFTNSGKNIISLVNTGKTNATITLSMTGLPSSGFTIFNLLKGESVTNGFVMKPEEVLLLELRVDGKTELLRINEAPDCLKQNGTGSIKLDYKATEPRDIHVDIQDLSDFKGVGKSKVRVDGEGTIVVNIEARENLRLNENYRLNIYMTEADKDFSATVEEISGGKIVVVEENCIDNILSIDTFEKLEDFKIYPVPFNDKLIISNVESLVTEFKLISLNGKKLIQGKDKGDITIDTQWLSKGVYFVQLLDGNNEIKHIIKVIK